MALRPPATRPAAVPAAAKSVGAPARNAQTTAANGPIVRSGMKKRHVSHVFPMVILGHVDQCADASATMANNEIATKGREANAKKLRPTAPGRANSATLPEHPAPGARDHGSRRGGRVN